MLGHLTQWPWPRHATTGGLDCQITLRKASQNQPHARVARARQTTQRHCAPSPCPRWYAPGPEEAHRRRSCGKSTKDRRGTKGLRTRRLWKPLTCREMSACYMLAAATELRYKGTNSAEDATNIKQTCCSLAPREREGRRGGQCVLSCRPVVRPYLTRPTAVAPSRAARTPMRLDTCAATPERALSHEPRPRGMLASFLRTSRLWRSLRTH